MIGIKKQLEEKSVEKQKLLQDERGMEKTLLELEVQSGLSLQSGG